jgi:hypothetical protein
MQGWNLLVIPVMERSGAGRSRCASMGKESVNTEIEGIVWRDARWICGDEATRHSSLLPNRHGATR